MIAVRADDVEAGQDLLAGVMDGPVVAMESVVLVDGARSGVARTGDLAVHVVDVRLEVVQPDEVDRRVDEVDGRGERPFEMSPDLVDIVLVPRFEHAVDRLGCSRHVVATPSLGPVWGPTLPTGCRFVAPDT
jgi:hypothetical protein